VSPWEKAGPVVVLDLRDGDRLPAGASGLHACVQAALAEEDQPEARAERFLVLDRADLLLEHQEIYERVLSYGSHGSVRLLCLAFGLPREAAGEPGGPPPGAMAGAAAPAGPWMLRRPALLRPPNVAVVWVGDLRAGRARRLPGTEPLDSSGPDGAGALRPLVDLLRGHELFDEVLRAVGAGSDGVVVPALRMLELDLGGEAKDRAYRRALIALAGDRDERQATADHAASRVQGLPEPLPGLVDPARAASAWGWQLPGGRADQAYRRCDQGLGDAEVAYFAVRRWTGLLGLGPAGRASAVPDHLAEAAAGLKAYRELAVRALWDSDGGPGLSPERRERLARLGIALPAAELSGEQVGDGLWEHLLHLLEGRVALRSAAALLTRLAARLAPGGSAAGLAALEERCQAGLEDDISSAAPFSLRGAAPAQLAGAFTAAALAALLPRWGLVAGLLVAVVQGGLTLLAGVRRPNRTADGERDGGASTGALALTIAGAAGAAAGALLAATTTVPPWGGLLALAAGLVLAVGLALRRWTAAVDLWWAHTRAAEARQALLGVESVLAGAVRDKWFAANARLHGSDSSRAAAGLLRRLADVAERVASEVAPAADQPILDREGGFGWGATSNGGAPAGGHATPVWLERAAGEAGPELVGTLVGDLADAAVTTLAACWGVVASSPGDARLVPVEERFEALLGVSRQVLVRHGITHPPPFVRHPERRATPPVLLDVGGDRLAQVLGAGDGPDGVVPLCAAEQKRLLSRDPAAACWIRFAPASSRVTVGASAASVRDAWRGLGPDARPSRMPGGDVQRARARDDVLWTSTSPFAGVLCLTPVRRDAVAVVRPRREGPGERKT
jgi:hypothetical protein